MRIGLGDTGAALRRGQRSEVIGVDDGIGYPTEHRHSLPVSRLGDEALPGVQRDRGENGDASYSVFLYLCRRGTIVAGLVSSASGFAKGGLRYLDASSRALGDLDQPALLALLGASTRARRKS